MQINLPGHKSVSKPAPTKTSKSHFAAAAQKVAKKRSGNLQHGVPHHAAVGGVAPFTSGISQPGVPNQPHQATEGQTALNPKQQGASSKNMQRGRGVSFDG